MKVSFKAKCPENGCKFISEGIFPVDENNAREDVTKTFTEEAINILVVHMKDKHKKVVEREELRDYVKAKKVK